MRNRKIWRGLDKLFISGKYRRWFSKKYIEFEIHIYFKPSVVDMRILDIQVCGIDTKKLKMNFSIGDDISIAKKWCELKGYDSFELNRSHI